MLALLDHKTDNTYNSNINRESSFLWSFFYDLYAPIMYGSILILINNKKHADNILLESFLMLKETKLCANLRKPLSLGILFHTHKVAVSYLKLKKLKLKTDDSFYNQNPNLKNLNTSAHKLTLANQLGNIQELKIPVHLKDQINLFREKPPLELVLPASSLSSFYFFMKNSY
jgi:hypothetical protein